MVPVAKAAPPVATSNQLMVPAEAVAFNVSFPASHTWSVVVVLIVGVAVTVAVTTVLEELQLFSVAST